MPDYSFGLFIRPHYCALSDVNIINSNGFAHSETNQSNATATVSLSLYYSNHQMVRGFADDKKKNWANSKMN